MNTDSADSHGPCSWIPWLGPHRAVRGTAQPRQQVRDDERGSANAPRRDDPNPRIEHLAAHHALAFGRRGWRGEDAVDDVHPLDDMAEHRIAEPVAGRAGAGVEIMLRADHDGEIALRGADRQARRGEGAVVMAEAGLRG